MAMQLPHQRDDEIVRKWLREIYKAQASCRLTVEYAKASPPAGTAKFWGATADPLVAVFECHSYLSEEENPFKFIRDWND